MQSQVICTVLTLLHCDPNCRYLVICFQLHNAGVICLLMQCIKLKKEYSFAVLLQNVCHGRNVTEIFIKKKKKRN